MPHPGNDLVDSLVVAQVEIYEIIETRNLGVDPAFVVSIHDLRGRKVPEDSVHCSSRPVLLAVHDGLDLLGSLQEVVEVAGLEVVGYHCQHLGAEVEQSALGR